MWYKYIPFHVHFLFIEFTSVYYFTLSHGYEWIQWFLPLLGIQPDHRTQWPPETVVAYWTYITLHPIHKIIIIKSQESYEIYQNPMNLGILEYFTNMKTCGHVWGWFPHSQWFQASGERHEAATSSTKYHQYNPYKIYI